MLTTKIHTENTESHGKYQGIPQVRATHQPFYAAFLYFDFSFAVWVLNGAMGPFISEQFHLTPAQIGLMVSDPTLSPEL